MKNKRIGILFIFKSSWLGGLYYIMNIIKSFNFLKPDSQPEIVLFYNKRTEKYLKDISYPKIEFVEIDLDFSLKLYLKSFVFRKNFFFLEKYKDYNLDILFPFNDFVGNINRGNLRLASWIPDFQHKFYPEYFGKLNLFLREIKFKNIVDQSDVLVLSSNSAHNDLTQFYNTQNGPSIGIVRFTSIIDENDLFSGDSILNKYSIPNNYFIVSNQFYPHKNHILVLKALNKLKGNGVIVNVIFTGMPDKRDDNPLLIEIDDYIKNNGLNDQVKILGLIPRVDQLSIMKYSKAIIQPSKFEGWSTVIEDGKTLNKVIISSDLDVHLEQLQDKGIFFKNDDVIDLALRLQEVIELPFNTIKWGSLEDRTENFALEILNALYADPK